MDPNALVNDGANGLARIAAAFRAAGIDLVAIYMIRQTLSDDEERWTIRLVTDEISPHVKRDVIVKLIQLRRDGKLPFVDEQVVFNSLDARDFEAARVIDYAQQFGGAPATIRNVMWKGLFIEYAVVGLAPERDVAAA